MLLDWLLRKRVPHNHAPDVYQYNFHPEYSRGAAAFSFEPKFTLPVFQMPIPHPELTFRNAPSPLQSPQVYVWPGQVPAVGLGGLIPGQLATQGLQYGNNQAQPPFEVQP